MPMKLLSTDDFRAAVKDGEQPEGTLFKFATVEPETVDGAERTKRFVFSDATIDHSGDKIDPKGWDLKVFQKNPVALFSHMSWDPPIGRASNVHVADGKLVGDIQFATADVYDFADTIFRLVDGGFLKACSVGFKPNEWSFTNDKDRPYGIDFKRQTLLEISVCAVPCNPSALTEARSIGVDTRPLVQWAERVLDSGDTVFLPRKDMEALRSQASGVSRPTFYFEAARSLTADEVKSIRVGMERLKADPAESLILPAGVTLRSIGDDEPTPEAEGNEALDAAVVEALKAPSAETLKTVVRLAVKAGRRVSAATKAKLQAAMDMSGAHNEAMTKCIKDLMDGEEPDDNEPDSDPDDMTDKAADPVEPVVADTDEDLTPEQRRMKEVRALKATIPPND